MKKKSIIIALAALLAGTTLPSVAQSYYIEDDIYYSPKDKNPVVEQKEKEKQQIQTTTTTTTTTVTTTTERDVDEYNRRGTTFMYESDEVAPGDTVYIQPEEGYYLDDFNGSLSDYEYTVRIHRFHDPRYAISISDPAYMDIYLLDSNDWNVYIEGPYAWVTPTWTNPWYWNYTWAPYSYSSMAWRWNYGWASASWAYYDPWRWSFGWNYPYYGWGYPYYGWGYPHHGWGHPCYGWHHHDWYYGNNYKPYGRGPGRHYGSNTASRNPETSTGGNRYGGSFTAESRNNSVASSSRLENATTGTSGRGSRYTITSPQREQNAASDNSQRGTTVNNTRRGTINSDVQTGTVSRRTSNTGSSDSYAPSQTAGRRNSTTATGRTTINNNTTGSSSVSRRPASSSSSRSTYTPSQSSRQSSSTYNNSSRNTSRSSSVSAPRSSSGGSRSSGTSGGGRGSRR